MHLLACLFEVSWKNTKLFRIVQLSFSVSFVTLQIFILKMMLSQARTGKFSSCILNIISSAVKRTKKGILRVLIQGAQFSRITGSIKANQ